MKKLYFVNTNAYNAIISDDGELRRVISNEYIPQRELTKEEALEALEAVEDDSSWEEYKETVEELADDFEIVAEIEKEL